MSLLQDPDEGVPNSRGNSKEPRTDKPSLWQRTKTGKDRYIPASPALGRQDTQAEPGLCLYLAGDMTQLEEYLPSKHEGLGSIPSSRELDVIAHA